MAMSTKSGIKAPTKRIGSDSADRAPSRNGSEAMSRSSSVSTLASVPEGTGTCMFVVGDRAYVNGTKPGTIQYLGETQFAPGIWAGVQLDETDGKNDGSVGGVKYFECEPMRGIFIRPHRLTKEPGVPPPVIGDSPSQTSPPKLSPDGRTTPSRNQFTPPRPSSIKLRVGDRVVVNSTSGVKRGILRFLGTTDFQTGEWAGIELDESIGKNDGSVGGKRYFECLMNRGLFAPAQKVFKEGSSSASRAMSHPMCLQHRSYSRESLDSNASSIASRGSRVKLGITSLHKSQKPLKSPSSALSPTQTNALQQALREKEEHLDQLFNERERQRQEIATLSIQLGDEKKKTAKLQGELMAVAEKAESKVQQLQNIYEKAELDAKNSSTLLVQEKRKIEDMQFQFEEEKSELEVQMQQERDKVNQLENLLKSEKENAEIIDKLRELETALHKKDSLLKRMSVEKQALEVSLKGKESDIADLNSNLQAANDNMKSMKTEGDDHSSLQMQLTSLEKDKQQLNNKNYEIVVKMAELENKLKENDQQAKKAESELQNLQSVVSGKDAEIVRLNTSVDSVRQNNEDLKLELGQLLSLKGEIAALIKEKEANRNEQSSKIQHWEKLVSDKEKQICSMKSDKINLEKTVDEKTKEMSNLSHLLEQEKADKKSSAELKEMSAKESIEKINDLTADISQLKTLLNAKENKLKEHENAIASLNQTLNEKGTKVAGLEQLLSEAQQKYSGEINMNKSQHQNLLEKITNLQSECAKHETTLDEKKAQHNDEIKRLQMQIKSQEDLKRNMETEIQDLSNEVNGKNDAILSLTGQLKQVTDEVSMLNTNKSEMTVMLQNKINDMKKEAERNRSEFESALKCSCADKEKLTKLLDEQEKISVKNSTSEATLKDTVQQKDMQLSKLTSELEHSHSKIEDFNSRINSLMTQLSDMEAEKKTVMKEKDEMCRNVADLNSQVSKHSGLLKDKQDETSVHQNQVKELNQMLKTKEDQVTELANLIKDSQKKLEELNLQNEKNLATMESKIAVYKAEQEKHLQEKEKVLQAEISKLESQLAQKDTSEKSHQTAISEMKNAIVEKENSIHSLEKSMKDQEQKMSDSLELGSAQITERENKLTSLRTQCETLAKDRDEIAQREKAANEVRQALQKTNDALIHEKTEQVALIKDKEAKMQLLQQDVERMKKDFCDHRQELQKKLDVSETELAAMKEFKAELDLQQGVVEELQKQLQESENKQRTMQLQLNRMPEITEGKKKLEERVSQLDKQLSESHMKSNSKKGDMDKLVNDMVVFQTKLAEKEAEVEVLKLRLEFNPGSKQQQIASDLAAQLKTYEQENAALLAEISSLKLSTKAERGDSTCSVGDQKDDEERDSLRSQISFLNSIIVDMQREKEEMKSNQENANDDALAMDINFNGVRKIPPRLFCDICDMFDLHDTEDCPTQASCLEEVPHSRHHGNRREERPYCNNCEVFGHWSIDCDDTQTF